MDWFRYDRDLCHERVKGQKLNIIKKSKIFTWLTMPILESQTVQNLDKLKSYLHQLRVEKAGLEC